MTQSLQGGLPLDRPLDRMGTLQPEQQMSSPGKANMLASPRVSRNFMQMSSGNSGGRGGGPISMTNN